MQQGLHLVVRYEHEPTRKRARELRGPAAPEAADNAVAAHERSIGLTYSDMLALLGDAGRVGDDEPAHHETEGIRENACDDGGGLRDRNRVIGLSPREIKKLNFPVEDAKK